MKKTIKTIYIDEEIYNKFKVKCVMENKSMSGEIEKFIIEQLKKEGKK